MLVEPRLSQAGFVEWFQRHRPDLVIGHVQAMVDWMRNLELRVPADTGFFNLNGTEQTMACAGLDLQPQRLGAAAIQTIVAMLHRQESGIPTDPQTITLEGKWVEGPTLRGPESGRFQKRCGCERERVVGQSTRSRSQLQFRQGSRRRLGRSGGSDLP